MYRLLKKETVGSRVLLKNKDKILLVKHYYDKFWVLPGGAISKNENEFDAAKREVLEEAGLEITGPIVKFGTYKNTQGNKNDTVILFVAEDFKKSAKRQRLIDKIEIQKIDFFTLDNLPAVSPSTKRRIEEFITNKSSAVVREW